MQNTQADKIQIRGEDWAVKVFRPLLKDLEIAKLTSTKKIFTSQYKVFNKYSMARCIVVVHKHSFNNAHHKGVFIWQYNEDNDFHALYILLNSNLFESATHDEKVIRKRTSTHEFVHCVATLLSIGWLKTDILIQRAHKKMKNKIHALTKDDVQILRKKLTLSFKEKNKYKEEFGDSHYRTGYESFDGNYELLEKQLLLSYGLFCEKDFFDDKARSDFYVAIDNKKSDEILKIITTVVQNISEKKSLDEDFVVKEFLEIFLPKILKEKVKKN